MNSLFSDDKTKLKLARANNKIETLTCDNDFEYNRNKFIASTLESMSSQPNSWDEFTQINIEWIGHGFLELLDDLDNLDNLNSKLHLDRLCAQCFRFSLEFYLSTKSEVQSDYRKYIIENKELLGEKAKSQIEFAIADMPISIVKRIVNGNQVENINEFIALYKEADSLRTLWNSEIKNKEQDVNKLKASLEKYETAFNFVGLYDGFNDLFIEKTNEKNTILKWLRLLSVLLVCPMATELFILYNNISNIEAIKPALLLSIIPMISLMAIMIYYFRILLVNYNSVKSQLLQINLRRTLCRFIQDYTNYSSKMKQSDSEALSKFESVIFAGIVNDAEKLPSTFDGVEQLSKLIKSLK